MDRDEFWTLIEAARAAGGDDCRQQTAHLVAALQQRSVDDILAFDRILYELMAESYRWDLWGAAYVINGGCSDDGFDYFRGWLIAQGEQVFAAALQDPDSLATELPDSHDYDAECETLLYVEKDAYVERAGAEMPWTANPPNPDMTID